MSPWDAVDIKRRSDHYCLSMKRINFASGSLITSDAVAASLLEYVAQMSSATNAATVEIPVLEDGGSVSTHTVVVSSSIQFEVADVEVEVGAINEDATFPLPEFPQIDTMVAVTPTQSAIDDAANVNRAIADIDNMLDQPES